MRDAIQFKPARSFNRFPRTSFALLASAAACAQWAHAATESWTATSGNWAAAANWNSGAGPVPGAGDTVDITDDDDTSRTITYNYIGAAVTLASVTVDNDGATGFNTLSMTSTGMALNASNENFGDSGTRHQCRSAGPICA